MSDEAFDYCLAVLNCIPDTKMLEKLDNALHANDDILFFNEYFDKSHLFLIKNIVLMQILIRLILIVIKTFIKMILILYFMSDFWLNVATKRKAKDFKKR